MTNFGLTNLGLTNLGRLLLLSVAALLCAACQRHGEYFGRVDPPQENVFRFNNGAEPEYLDPALLTGHPDSNIARLLFEGLIIHDPRTMEPVPGAAERWEISPDQTTYTFHLRSNAIWSNGQPLTAGDFVYSWTRALDPKTASRYASQLYAIKNGEAFNQGTLQDASQLGLRAIDSHTLEVTLEQPVSYFLFLVSHTTYMPVPKAVVEKHGEEWTRPENIVGNGAFLLAEHRPNLKMEFVPNPRYWNAERVRLDRVIAYAVDDLHTSANLYEAGELDWVPSGYFPAEYVPYMQGRFKDIETAPFLTIYYYTLNTTRPPLDNPKVRRALAMAVDRRAITDELLRGGQIPTSHLVPVGFRDYQSPPGQDYNPQEAARLLAEAGYPNGQGFPELNILFNSLESHKRIAETIQQMWATTLHVHVSIRNEEWASYLKSVDNKDYDIARAGWIGDYPDPTTFTDLLLSTSGNNRTGWASAEYDRYLELARKETDPQRRFALIRQAEALMLEESPVIPIYTYVINSLLKPYVRGIYPTILDIHLLSEVWIDHHWRERDGNGEDGGA